MKKVMYVLILTLIVVSGFVYANLEANSQKTKKQIQKPLSAAEKNAAMKKWEATPDGIMYKKWENSPEGKKVFAAEDKIWKNITDYTNMDGVVTSLSLPAGSRLGFGLMVKINNENYIITFDAEKSQLEQLRSLKVNDRITIKSRNISHAPKYSYPIISCEYLERDQKVIFKRIHRKGGC